MRSDLRSQIWRSLAASLCCGVLLASSDFQSGDPSQWSTDDVYRILHDSPWTKTVKVSSSGGGGTLADNSPNANAPVTSPGNAGGMGGRGMGRRGMGGGSGGTYSSGRSSSGGNTKSQPTEVTIQWQSALPVRLAAAKNEGPTTAPAPANPNEYVVAVIGLPLADFGGRAATSDQDSTNSEDVNQKVEQELKRSASLIRPHHEPLTPTKIEMDQGKDGRTLFYFSKQDPITIKDKTVEFRIANGHAAIHKTFALKEMVYQSQLEL